MVGWGLGHPVAQIKEAREVEKLAQGHRDFNLGLQALGPVLPVKKGTRYQYMVPGEGPAPPCCSTDSGLHDNEHGLHDKVGSVTRCSEKGKGSLCQ